jgi:phage host-nuclease inhibitor protein Gam
MTVGQDEEELAEFLAADVDVAIVETEADPDGEPIDAPQANRFIRRIALLDKALADAEEQASAEIALVHEWIEERRRRIEADRRWLVSALEAYARNAHERTGLKTFNLVGGTLRLRPARPNVVVVNEDALIAWAEANDLDAFVRVKKEVSLAAIHNQPVSAPTVTVEADEVGDPEAYKALMRQLADCEAHRPYFDGEPIPGVVVATRLLDSFRLTLR